MERIRIQILDHYDLSLVIMRTSDSNDSNYITQLASFYQYLVYTPSTYYVCTWYSLERKMYVHTYVRAYRFG